jgi:hypothetical protein
MVPPALRRLYFQTPIGFLAVALLVLLPAGCQREGSGGPNQGQSAGQREKATQGTTNSRARPPNPRASLADGVREFQAAVEKDDCSRIRAIAFYGNAQLKPEACKAFVSSIAGFDPEDREQYRTAGVVDFATKRRRAPGTMAFLLAKDGRFRWAVPVSRLNGEKVVGTRPPSRLRLDGIAASAVKAFRSGRCQDLQERAKGILPDPGQPRRQCEGASGLRRALERDPSARPKRLGANEKLAFYSILPQDSGPYATLILQVQRKRVAFSSVFVVPSGGKE